MSRSEKITVVNLIQERAQQSTIHNTGKTQSTYFLYKKNSFLIFCNEVFWNFLLIPYFDCPKNKSLFFYFIFLTLQKLSIFFFLLMQKRSYCINDLLLQKKIGSLCIVKKKKKKKKKIGTFSLGQSKCFCHFRVF